MDEWDRLHAENMQNPRYADAYRRAQEQWDHTVSVPCSWGWCSHSVDSRNGKIHSGFGPVACPCDHLPGWRSPYVEGQAKPSVPVKVKGRHGSRVQRSKARHRLPKGYLSGLVGDTGMYPAVAEARNRGMLEE